MPDYRYTTPSEGNEAVPLPMEEIDTALVATNPDHRGPEVVALFASGLKEDVDTDKIEAFPEAAHMVAAAELAAKWEVIGLCHDAMTLAGIPLTKASEIMAEVVRFSGVAGAPSHRGPNGTLRGGNAPHGGDFKK